MILSKNYGSLKKYQKHRDSCKFCINKSGMGLWCVDKNFKCSYDNCPNKTDPLISCGTNNKLNGGVFDGGNSNLGVTEKQIKVFKLRESGLSFQRIGDKLGMTKKNAWKLYQKAIRVYKYKGGNDRVGRVTNEKEGGNDIRLHNDVVSFEMSPIVFNKGDSNIRHLRFCDYLNVNVHADYYIKIFTKKLIVGFRKDIVCKSVDECKFLAEERIKDFLSNFNYFDMDLNLNGKTKQVSRHYAILGVELAKKFVKEKEKIHVYDRVDKRRRISIDFSNEKPEFEAEHLVHGDTSAEKWHSIIDDVEHNPSYLPSFQSKALDSIIQVQKDYAENIKLHLKVMNNINNTLKEIKEIAKK